MTLRCKQTNTPVKIIKSWIKTTDGTAILQVHCEMAFLLYNWQSAVVILIEKKTLPSLVSFVLRRNFLYCLRVNHLIWSAMGLFGKSQEPNPKDKVFFLSWQHNAAYYWPYYCISIGAEMCLSSVTNTWFYLVAQLILEYVCRLMNGAAS